MAAAVRLIGTGSFGEDVVHRLSGSLPHAQVLGAGRLQEAFTDGSPSLVVLALWRPSPDLCERADALAASHRVPWIPVIMEHPVLRIGPYVRADAGPCFRCYRSRRVQHDDQHRATAALHAAYDATSECGPRGYLPHHARLAAVVLASHLEHRKVGRVTTVQIATARLHTHHVVACHGCDRCGVPSVSGHGAILSVLARS
jgi:bacteriocin biosynthesis cyclodehydratase domain-containing protein